MLRAPLLVVALAGCAPSPTTTNDDDTAVLATDLFEGPSLRVHLDALADIAEAHDGHRALGSSGYDASVAYVVEVLEDLGYAPRLDPFSADDFLDNGTSLQAGDQAVPTSALRWSVAGAVTANVFPVDITDPPGPQANTSTSGCQAEDFAGFPAGRIALVQRGACTFTTKATLAADAGASAVIVFNEGQPNRTGRVVGELDADAPPTIPVVGVSHSAGLALRDLGAPVTLEVRTERVATPSQNVLVDLAPSSGPRWIVGGHLDSVPEGPGINDNGSGVAMLLQLAAALQGTTRPITLAFWGGEEAGLLGSLDYTRRLDDPTALAGYLNLDMAASPNAAHFIYDGDGSTFPLPDALPPSQGAADIEAAYLEHFAERGIPTDPVPFDGRSDYLGFALLGVPSGGVFTGAEGRMTTDEATRYDGDVGLPYDACYHLACDDRSNLDLTALETMSVATFEVLRRLAATPSTASRPTPRAVPRRLEHDHGAHGHAPHPAASRN